MKHEIGKTIGNLRLDRYTEIKDGRRSYILVCTCGKEILGTNLSIQRAEEALKTQNVSGCMNCIRKSRAENKAQGDGAYRDIFVRYKKGAKNRNINWELSFQQAAQLFAGNCVYCGDAPKGSYSRSKYYKTPYNGIDRVNTKLGYIPTNVVSCCRACNVAKHEFTVDEFMHHVKKIYDFQRLSRKGVESSDSKQEGSSLD